ncbi:MAG: SRPBCC domain-containing protein [Gammaproteobacteria bacterium]
MTAFDPQFDLFFERFVDVPKERVWQAWTEAEYLKQWFTPAPWKTVDWPGPMCLRPVSVPLRCLPADSR